MGGLIFLVHETIKIDSNTRIVMKTINKTIAYLDKNKKDWKWLLKQLFIFRLVGWLVGVLWHINPWGLFNPVLSIWFVSELFVGNFLKRIARAHLFEGREPLQKKRAAGYDTKLPLMVRLKFWRTKKYRVQLHFHYSQVHLLKICILERNVW